MRSRSLPYAPALDGLRTVAVALVFVIHAFPTSTFPGALGVDVFFVLSGFLITRVLMGELERFHTIRLRRFYFRRALRLYPPLIVVVVVMALVHPLAGTDLAGTRNISIIALVYLSNVFVTYTQHSMAYLDHTWSLAMEEQFYLVWPALLLLLQRLRASHRVVAIVAATLATISFTFLVIDPAEHPHGPLQRVGGLLVGCVAAFAFQDRPRRDAQLAWAGITVIVAGMVSVTMGVLPERWVIPVVSVALVPLLLHLTFGEGPLLRVLSLRPMVYLGTISYEIYLWHYPLLWILHRTALSLPAAAIIGLAGTLILSDLTHRFVSRPVLAWRKRREERTKLAAQAAPPPGQDPS